jgi:hypothetical protein
MNKPLQIGLLAAAIVVALGLVAFLFFRDANAGSGNWTDNERRLADALDKVGGDPNKLDPASKKLFDQTVMNNPMSSRAHYGAGSKPGGAPASGSTPSAPSGSPIPNGYPVPGSSR